MRHLGPLWLVLLEVPIPHRDFTVLQVMLPQKHPHPESPVLQEGGAKPEGGML